MPYSNVPGHLQDKMERCVAQVKAKSSGKNAYAICYRSVVGGSVKSAANNERRKK